MAVATAQLNVRVPAELKRGGDEVLSRFGISASEAVRGLLDYVVSHQAPPEFLAKPTAVDTEGAWADDGCGLAVQAAGLAAGTEVTRTAAAETPAAPTWEDERDALYDDLLDRMERACH